MLQKFIFSANSGCTAAIIYQAGVTEFKGIAGNANKTALSQGLAKLTRRRSRLAEISLRVLNLVEVLHSWAYKDIHLKLRLSNGKLLNFIIDNCFQENDIRTEAHNNLKAISSSSMPDQKAEIKFS